MANEQTWAVIKNSKWQQLYGSQFSGANIITYHRWWHSMAIQNVDVYDDLFTLTEEVDIDVIKYVDDTDPVALTEDITSDFEKVRTEWLILTDSVALQPQRIYTDSVALTDAIEYFLALGRQGEDVVSIPEDVTFDIVWHIDETIGIEETRIFEVSWVKQDNVGITESTVVRLELQEVHVDLMSITDEVRIVVWDTSESGGMSLVDDVRVAVQDVLGLSDAEVALLSINDLLHRYWSADFEDGVHSYDGSESTFTPAEAHSIMDHHSSVEANEGTDLNWIRSVTAE